MLTSVLGFFLVLGVVVVLHEAGHFLAARVLGAPVAVFSFGFGKRLWGFERGGTDYRISLIPFGGYVRVVGLGPDESDLGSGEVEAAPLLPRWQRALILLAGPITNVIAAVGLVAVAYMVGIETPVYLKQAPEIGWVDPASPAATAGMLPGDFVRTVDGQAIASWRDLDTALLTAGGREVMVTFVRAGATQVLAVTPQKVTRYGFGYAGLYPPLEPVVVRLVPGSPAQRVGIAPGDRIVAVNGERVAQFWDLVRLVSPHAEEQITLGVVREGRELTVEVVPRDEGGEGKIGIALVFPEEVLRLSPAAALTTGVQECRRMTRETFRVIGRLLTRRASIRQVSGPIDIARISGEAAQSGFHTLVWLMGVISLQLGIFNLLPIPILDGGHLTILAFESTIRRDLSTRVKERILEVGFVVLVLLMVVVLFNDIVKVLPDSVYRLISRG